MFKFVLSIRPECRASLSPKMVESILAGLGRVEILEGAGERTMTIATDRDLSQLIATRLPEVTLRPYRALHLL